MKNYKRSVKNFGKGLKGTALIVASMPLFATPVTSIAGSAMVVKGAKSVADSLYKNYVENSIMVVKKQKSGDYMIGQSLPSMKQFLEATSSENKMDFLKLQECNMLLQLDSKNENKEPIKYTTRTHVGNYRMLMQLQKSGIITNLSKEPAGTSSLKIEKMLIGNSSSKEKSKEDKQKRRDEIRENVAAQKGLFNKIKTFGNEMKNGLGNQTKMYNITFEKTDKVLSDKEIGKMLPFILKENSIDDKKFNVSRDSNGNISQIDYSMKYVLETFKNRAREKMKNRASSIRDNLKNLTNSVSEIVKSEKIRDEFISKNSREDLSI